MFWLEHMGANRALAAASGLAAGLAVQSWKQPMAALASAWRRRAARVRAQHVSPEWLRQFEVENAKREG